MPNRPSAALGGWFDRLVKNDMGTVAAPVAGVAVSFVPLTLSRVFDGVVYWVLVVGGSVMLIPSSLLLVTAIGWHVYSRIVKAPPSRKRATEPPADKAA